MAGGVAADGEDRRHLFDGMAGGLAADGEDRISALPDDLLRRVLSFLPSHDSVWTCVLARRWRDLWKSVPAVRVEGEPSWFVSSLLLLRDRAPLDEFEVKTYENQDSRDVELWLRYAASCHVQVLRCDIGVHFWLPNITLVCQQLTRLELSGMTIRDRTLDLSGCPVLDVLEMYYCQISADRILCQSLRHLCMESCFTCLDVRTRISCPSLRAFKIVDYLGLTPFLESMPSLVTAFFIFKEDSEDVYDHCRNGGYYGDCDDESCLACYHIDNEGNECVLLHGLSGVAELTLISSPEMIICTRDFKWRYIFSMLKTLYLGEWCLAADYSGLVYFLQHSPILERLTVQLGFYKPKIIYGKYETDKQILLSKNLKVVEIKERKDDKRIMEILSSIVKILLSLGVPSDCIRFEQG